MGPEGIFEGNTLNMSWDPVVKGDTYSIVIEKCDNENGYDVCHQIFSKVVKNTTQLIQTSEKFSECAAYTLKVSMNVSQISMYLTTFLE